MIKSATFPLHWPAFRNLLLFFCLGAAVLYGNARPASLTNYIDSKNASPTLKSEVSKALPGDSVIVDTICGNSFYPFNGLLLTESGVYDTLLTGSDGSDSLVTLFLEVLPVDETFLTAEICEGSSYDFGGEILTTAGDYFQFLINGQGCDSIVSLSLSVLPAPQTAISATICGGETFEFDGEILSESGDYSATYQTANGCDSVVTLTLEVLPPFVVNIEAGICEGSSYIFGGDTLIESGDYTLQFSGANGCDSTINLSLSVVTEFVVNSDISICAGETYVFSGDTLDASGVYTDTLTAQGGCDSILNLTLTVLPNAQSSLSAQICEGDTYIFGNDTLSNAGTYTQVLAAANGCDSTVTLALTVVNQFETETSATICAGETYFFAGDTLDESGVYTATYSSQSGCDSILTLNLTVLPTFQTNLEATICETELFIFNGEVLLLSGIYTANLTAANGCDSTVTLDLTVLQTSGSSVEASICAGDSYEYQDSLLTEAGVYEFTYTGANGCDSIFAVFLTVLQPIETVTEATICAGKTYGFSGEVFDASGSYSFSFTAANGCDSVSTLDLTVLPTQNVHISATICAGESYGFDGQDLTQAGDYTATFAGANGCDSTVNLTLVVLPNTSGTASATICANETYDFYGQTLSAAGDYTTTLTAANGCDSVLTLTLFTLPLSHSDISATICSNEGYPYNGQLLTEAGDYNFTFTGANGCDSTVTLALTVLTAPASIETVTICAGETYEFNGETFDASGSYLASFTAENGCDSTARLDLTVLEPVFTDIEVTICENGSYSFNGQILDTAGVYTAVLTSESGCDSTVTLRLSKVALFENFSEQTVCAGESVDFYGQLLNQSGDYSQTFQAFFGGCDSVIHLSLKVLPPAEDSLETTICAGKTYSFHGQLLTQSGTYTASLISAAGCDSTLTLNLTVLPTAASSFDATICAGEGYPFAGQILTVSGNYDNILIAENGCDSTVTLHLTVLPAYAESVNASICAGEQLDYGGQILTDAGTYTFDLTAENGCDSVVSLTLTVLPISSSSLTQAICAGQSYDFNGQNLTEAGDYTAVVPAANGCDSIINLTLTVIPEENVLVEASTCDGEPFLYGGQSYAQSGSYTQSDIGPNGCTVVTTINLTVNPAIPPTEVSASICPDESYNFFGQNLTQSGTYNGITSAANGCDSTIRLTLTVLPNPTTTLDVSICEGESYTFGNEVITQAGTYMLAYNSTIGCDSLVTLNLSVISVNSGISLSGQTLSALAGNATYQWINCANNQPIAGATGASFTPTATGVYAVQVTQNGCTEQSDCLMVEVIGTEEPLNANNWSLRPNPAQTETAITLLEAAGETFRVEISDMAGRVLQSSELAIGATSLRLDLGNLPAGAFLVRLRAGAASSVKQLVIAR